MNPNAGGRLPRILATRLSKLVLVVDVQHLYRGSPHQGDRGSVYQLANGTHMHETDATLRYAAALVVWLRARSATVFTNGTPTNSLTGPYSRRHLDALRIAPHAYIAAHLNAGGGDYGTMEYLTPSSAGLALEIAKQLRSDFPLRIPRAVTRALRPGDRGVVCIDGLGQLPAVICEPFFGDNPEQQALLSAPQLQAVGESIGEGIARWWEARATISVA